MRRDEAMACIIGAYRKTDEERACRIKRHLANRLGNDVVFRNVDDETTAGKPERPATDILLLVIGPHWLTETSGKRFDDPANPLHAELAEALSTGRAILPVLVDGAIMPVASDIPVDLAAFAELKPQEMRDTRWNDDINYLLERIRDLLRHSRERMPLHAVQFEVLQLQSLFSTLLEKKNDAVGALDAASRILVLLDVHMIFYPTDILLLTTRGLTHKRMADALSHLGRDAEGKKQLDVADRVFSTMVEEFSQEPAAWDGKGTVERSRGNLEEALRCFDRALKLSPVYEDSLRNREAVMEEMGG